MGQFDNPCCKHILLGGQACQVLAAAEFGLKCRDATVEWKEPSCQQRFQSAAGVRGDILRVRAKLMTAFTVAMRTRASPRRSVRSTRSTIRRAKFSATLWEAMMATTCPG